MPFTFEPLETTREGSEFVLRGRLLSGGYFGPESIVLRSTDGHERVSHIHSHGVVSPEGWPVIPDHRKTVLILRIPAPPADFKITLVTGVGAVATATERVDITQVLGAPEFWAIQAAFHFVSEEVEDPGLEWLGIPQEIASKWYELHVGSHIRNGRSPYIRVSLPDSRYIELEMAGGVEYQDRVWIGQFPELNRVLLGYHSGHFSLPALRTEEVSWIAAQTEFSASGLLWLSTAYSEAGTYPLALAEALALRVPGLARGKQTAMSKALLQRLAVDRLSWISDLALGWINNWPYSQRNPKSLMTILKPADYASIREFFA